MRFFPWARKFCEPFPLVCVNHEEYPRFLSSVGVGRGSEVLVRVSRGYSSWLTQTGGNGSQNLRAQGKNRIRHACRGNKNYWIVATGGGGNDLSRPMGIDFDLATNCFEFVTQSDLGL